MGGNLIGLLPYKLMPGPVIDRIRDAGGLQVTIRCKWHQMECPNLTARRPVVFGALKLDRDIKAAVENVDPLHFANQINLYV